MDLRINKSDICNDKCLNFLHDKVAGKFNIINNYLKIVFWNSFSFEKKPEYEMIVSLGKSTPDFINVYLYKIEKGIINGTLSDIQNVINNNVIFEIVDIGYMNSVLFLKGSIIEHGKLDRNNIIIELCFDKQESFVEIKSCK